ncbi:MAG: peptidylprolyl isomerase [Verrucomicrobiaceae bacterium]|nr:peptidylprolyl isomerase [Verrucomicrobiaceae bacterium]
MKKALLLCPFVFLSLLSPSSAQLPVPEKLQPAATAPVGADIDKLADEAQRSVFQAADKNGTSTAAKPSGTTTAAPPLVSAPTRGTYTVPALTAREDPALWPKDSVHKLAIMQVSFGGTEEEVVIELYKNSAPNTVANFIDLCSSKFYDGLAFHRAIEDFLVQTGDPLTADDDKRDQWGTGGETRTLPYESSKRPHRLGTVAMARRADSVNPERRNNSSQFYFALGHYDFLEGKYTAFGQVVSGLETLEYISRMPVDSNDCPIARIEIASIRVIDHKGPLIPRAIAGKRGSKKSSAPQGMFGRFLSRVW